MKYRDVEYSVVQGITRYLWKWSFSIDQSIKSGQAATKGEAVKGAERAVDRALALKKLKLVHSDRD